MLDLLEDATHDWGPQVPLDWEPVATNGASGPLVKIERRRSDQSHLGLALPGLSLNDPDRYALSLLNVILGDGMSSRLFMDLRETRGLAYDVSSSINHFRDCGSMVVYCGVEPRKTNDAVRAVMRQLDGMREEAPERELHKAREYATGRLLLRMEDSRAVASWMGSQELLQEQLCSVDEIVGRLQAVTPADISSLATTLFQEEQLRLALVGPQGGPEDADGAAEAVEAGPRPHPGNDGGVRSVGLLSRTRAVESGLPPGGSPIHSSTPSGPLLSRQCAP